MSTDPRGRNRPADAGPTIEMTPNGEFVEIRRLGALPLSTKIMGIAILVAVLAGAAAVALLALWLALTLIPVLIAAALIAYGVFRVQLWWARRRSIGRQRDLFVP